MPENEALVQVFEELSAKAFEFSKSDPKGESSP